MTRVAVLIPSCGQRALANLARDAIAKFTTDVAHDVYLLDHDPWDEVGGDAHLRALRLLRTAIQTVEDYSHVFIMHDDALPLRAGWLGMLLARPQPAAAIVSRRNGRGHSAGTLFDRQMFSVMILSPKLPEHDVAESVPCGWGGAQIAWRPPKLGAFKIEPPTLVGIEWALQFDCDIALDAAAPFYVHLGGGTIGATGTRPDSAAHRARIFSWIRAARWGLGL